MSDSSFPLSEEEGSEEGDDYTWRVTMTDGKVEVSAGQSLSDLPANAVLYVIGKALINVGSNLLSSEASEDDDL